MKIFYFTLLLIVNFLSFNIKAYAVCPAGESELIVDIQLQAPTLAWETYWEVRDYKTNEIVLSANNGESGSYCLPSNGCYSYVIYDIPGDGLCCTENGNGGSYAIYYDNELINTGAEFTGSEFTGPFGCTTGTACSAPFTITEGTYSTPFAETWYSFSPTQSGLYRISTCFNNNECNTAIWVYDYCNNLPYNNNLEASIKFSANGCNNNDLAATQVNFIAGNKYYIRIGHLETCNSTIIWKLEYTAPVTDCNDPNACNYNPLTEISDPLACQYEGGNDYCAGPDFKIDEEALINSLYISSFQSSINDCYLNEGCVTGIGDRRVLRFDTKIYNQGSEDFYLGIPNNENPLWVFDECHQHFHFENYAEYILFDENNTPLPIGFKTGYCMEDTGCPNLGDYKFGCNVQGLTSGCYDLYAADTKCQWIDITDISVGKYTLVVRVNWEQKSDSLGRYEQDYSNNWGQVCFELFRDAENEPFFEVFEQCDILVDCYGDAYGNATLDCNGECNGNALLADVTGNGIYQQNDFTVLSQHILANQQYVKCYDPSGNGTIDFYDLTLLNSCIQNNANCNFPYSVPNTQASVQFSLADSLILIENERWVQVNLETPNTSLSAFEIGVDNAQIIDYQLNINGVDAEVITYPTNNKLSVIYRNTFIPVSNQTYTLMYLKLAAINNSLDICLQTETKAVNNLNQELSPTAIGCLTPEIYTANSTAINNNFELNIFNDNEFININLSENKAYTYQIFNLNGQLITGTNAPVSGASIIATAKMLSGIYIIELKVGEQTQRKKIIVFN